jgi:hypothetical protein
MAARSNRADLPSNSRTYGKTKSLFYTPDTGGTIREKNLEKSQPFTTVSGQKSIFPIPLIGYLNSER